jgi:hypothetical protein
MTALGHIRVVFAMFASSLIYPQLRTFVGATGMAVQC